MFGKSFSDFGYEVGINIGAVILFVLVFGNTLSSVILLSEKLSDDLDFGNIIYCFSFFSMLIIIWFKL